MKKEKKKVKNKVKEEEKQQEILDKKEQENLSEQIEKLNSENTELKDKLLRKAAEFENYKRRTDNEQSNLLKYTGEHIFTNLLPVIDDFERSLKHINDSQDVEALKSGLKLVYEKLIKVLTEQGIKKIEAVGKPFDVEYHEAIMQRKEEGVEPHIVLNEIETGYIYKDRVIRHTKVIVSEELIEEKIQENTEKEINGEEKEN